MVKGYLALVLLIGVSVCLKCCSEKFSTSTDLTSFRSTIFHSGGQENLAYAPCNLNSPYSGLQCDSHAAACLDVPSSSHPVGEKTKGEWKSPTQISYPAYLGHDGIKRSLVVNIECKSRTSTLLTYTSHQVGANALLFEATITVSSDHCQLKSCPTNPSEVGLVIILLLIFCCCCVPLFCFIGIIGLILSLLIGFLKFAAREAVDEGVRDILYSSPHQQYSSSNQPYNTPGYQ